MYAFMQTNGGSSFITAPAAFQQSVSEYLTSLVKYSRLRNVMLIFVIPVNDNETFRIYVQVSYV